MKNKCESCVNRTEFGSLKSSTGCCKDMARCMVFNMEVYAECGCEYHEENITKKRSIEDMPSVPVVNAYGNIININKYDFSNKNIELIIKTGNIFGRWYLGYSFEIKHGCMLGGGSYPNVHQRSFQSEREAISQGLRIILECVEHDAQDMPDIAEHIRCVITQQRQLTLF